MPDAVADRLRELNPGFDRQVYPVVEDGVVTGLNVETREGHLTAAGVAGAPNARYRARTTCRFVAAEGHETDVAEL